MISVGLFFYYVATLLKLPGLIGFLLAGILLGPNGLDLFSDTLLEISSDLRNIALIVILLRAGLGLNLTVIKRIGKRAALLSTIPALIEGFTLLVLASWFLDFSLAEAGMLGFIIAAVSPAVIVPSMIKLQQTGLGKKRYIPSLVLASASIDDIIAITFFSAFLSLYTTQQLVISTLMINIGTSIILGIMLGILTGLIIMALFTKFHIRDTKKVLLLIAVGLLIISGTDYIKDTIAISALLAIMVIGIIIVEKKSILASRLSIKLSKVWVLFELILFVLVGSLVNLTLAFTGGLIGVFIIFIGLSSRMIGVHLALLKSEYFMKERIFIMISFIPKATVQAALGSIPLMVGAINGEYILALSILAIIITAPLGALLIQYFSTKLLRDDTHILL